MEGNFEKMRGYVKVQAKLTESNRGRDEREDWVIYDSSLDHTLDRYSFSKDFDPLIPEGFNGLRDYITKKLAHKNGQAVGIEIAGTGSQLFRDLSKDQLFCRTAGFVLKDTRTANTKTEDREINHKVIPVSDAFSTQGYRAIKKFLGEKKADLIIERMVANLASFPNDPEYLYIQLNRLYKILAEQGVMLLMAPPVDRNDDTRRGIYSWINNISSNYGQYIDISHHISKSPSSNTEFFCIRLEKLKDAPKDLPKYNLIPPND
jgi:hypothetical protein